MLLWNRQSWKNRHMRLASNCQLQTGGHRSARACDVLGQIVIIRGEWNKCFEKFWTCPCSGIKYTLLICFLKLRKDVSAIIFNKEHTFMKYLSSISKEHQALMIYNSHIRISVDSNLSLSLEKQEASYTRGLCDCLFSFRKYGKVHILSPGLHTQYSDILLSYDTGFLVLLLLLLFWCL